MFPTGLVFRGVDEAEDLSYYTVSVRYAIPIEPLWLNNSNIPPAVFSSMVPRGTASEAPDVQGLPG